jgi:hypothetical protein
MLREGGARAGAGVHAEGGEAGSGEGCAGSGETAEHVSRNRTAKLNADNADERGFTQIIWDFICVDLCSSALSAFSAFHDSMCPAFSANGANYDSPGWSRYSGGGLGLGHTSIL